MTKRKEEATPERPAGGGSYVRDRKTGRLKRQKEARASKQEAQAPASETETLGGQSADQE